MSPTFLVPYLLPTVNKIRTTVGILPLSAPDSPFPPFPAIVLPSDIPIPAKCPICYAYAAIKVKGEPCSTHLHHTQVPLQAKHDQTTTSQHDLVKDPDPSGAIRIASHIDESHTRWAYMVRAVGWDRAVAIHKKWPDMTEGIQWGPKQLGTKGARGGSDNNCIEYNLDDLNDNAPEYQYQWQLVSETQQDFDLVFPERKPPYNWRSTHECAVTRRYLHVLHGNRLSDRVKASRDRDERIRADRYDDPSIIDPFYRGCDNGLYRRLLVEVEKEEQDEQGGGGSGSGLMKRKRSESVGDGCGVVKKEGDERIGNVLKEESGIINKESGTLRDEKSIGEKREEGKSVKEEKESDSDGEGGSTKKKKQRKQKKGSQRKLRGYKTD